MKRDMDLYRQILREVESWSTTLMPKEVTIEDTRGTRSTTTLGCWQTRG